MEQLVLAFVCFAHPFESLRNRHVIFAPATAPMRCDFRQAWRSNSAYQAKQRHRCERAGRIQSWLTSACLQVTLVRADVAEGRQVIGAHKFVLTQCDVDVRVKWGCRRDLTREAKVLGELQSHPCGHVCANLPQLLAANWEVTAAPAGVAGSRKKSQKLVKELLLEYADLGSLSELLKKRRALAEAEPVLPQKHQWAFSEGIGRALVHMHEAGWLHLDVKLQNVFIFASGRPVLGDLGLAERVGATVRRIRGTPGYMAPELARAYEEGKEVRLTSKMDVFALGVTMLWMALPPGAVEATGLSEAELRSVSDAGLLPGYLLAGRLDCSDEYRHIIKVASHPSPRKRASIRHMWNLIRAGRERAEAAQAAEAGAAQAAEGVAAQAAEAEAGPPLSVETCNAGPPADVVPAPQALRRVSTAQPACILAAVLNGATPTASHSATPCTALVATPAHALLGQRASLHTSCGGSPLPPPVTQTPVRHGRLPMPPEARSYAAVVKGLPARAAQPRPQSYAAAVKAVSTRPAQCQGRR